MPPTPGSDDPDDEDDNHSDPDEEPAREDVGSSDSEDDGPPEDDYRSPDHAETDEEELYQSDISLDTTLDLLALQERRDILRFLIDQPNQCAAVDDIIAYVADAKRDRREDVPSQEDLKVQLHHTHMPKLSSTGIIEYDERSKALRYWKDGRLEDWLDRIEAEKSMED